MAELHADPRAGAGDLRDRVLPRALGGTAHDEEVAGEQRERECLAAPLARTHAQRARRPERDDRDDGFDERRGRCDRRARRRCRGRRDRARRRRCRTRGRSARRALRPSRAKTGGTLGSSSGAAVPGGEPRLLDHAVVHADRAVLPRRVRDDCFEQRVGAVHPTARRGRPRRCRRASMRRAPANVPSNAGASPGVAEQRRLPVQRGRSPNVRSPSAPTYPAGCGYREVRARRRRGLHRRGAPMRTNPPTATPSGMPQPAPIRAFRRTAVGTVLAAGMLGLRDVLEPPKDETPGDRRGLGRRRAVQRSDRAAPRPRPSRGLDRDGAPVARREAPAALDDARRLQPRAVRRSRAIVRRGEPVGERCDAESRVRSGRASCPSSSTNGSVRSPSAPK